MPERKLLVLVAVVKCQQFVVQLGARGKKTFLSVNDGMEK
jgi:hypothetical protein